MEDEIESRRLDKLEEAVGSLKKKMQCLSMRFEQFFEMLEDKGQLAKQELGKGKSGRLSSRIVQQPSLSLNSVSIGSGGGSTNGDSRGDFGFFSVLGASRNAGPSNPSVSVFKSGLGENSSGGDGGSGGRGVFESVFGLFSIVGVPKNSQSSFSVGSGSKSRSSGNLGGGGSGSNGGLDFSGGGKGSEGGGFGMGGRIYFLIWENSLLGTKELPHKEGETKKCLDRNPKTLGLTAMLSSTDLLVLRRPLVDIVGARLQIGMMKSLGKEMQQRACCGNNELVEDNEDRKASECDRTTQVAATAVSYFPTLRTRWTLGGRVMLGSNI